MEDDANHLQEHCFSCILLTGLEVIIYLNQSKDVPASSARFFFRAMTELRTGQIKGLFSDPCILPVIPKTG